jgi:glucosamine--fructose-6-phosphate aminotransferase (isomerizing)
MDNQYQCYYEIINQAEAWKEAVETVQAQAKSIRSFFDQMQPGQIIFAGCTSPYYAGNSSATYWQSALGIPARAVPCSELIQFSSSYYATKAGKPVLVVLSRSGKTTETLWAVEQFEKQFPGRMLLIGCAPGTPLEKLANLKIMLPKGYEDTVPQTRSYSVMYLAAQMVGALISGQDKTLQDLISSPAIVSSIVQSSESIIKHANNLRQFQNIFCLGSGPLYGIAQEATLKMIEMTISDTICVPFMESRHGPRSLIDDRSLVIGLYTRAGSGYEAKVMDELTRNHKAVTVAICPDTSWDTGKVSYKIPVNCAWQDEILGLSYLPVIQLLAYYRAVVKGVNPDKSRNLTSFVEIAR